MLTGSAFTLNRETGRGGALSLWSHGARSRFSGREGALSLGGDVSTTMFGADYAKARSSSACRCRTPAASASTRAPARAGCSRR